MFLLACLGPAEAQLGAPELWLDGPADVQPGVDRTEPDAAVDGQGRSVVVWSAFGSGATQDRNDVFVRRFGLDREPLTDPLQVNTTFEDDQRSPTVAAAADGSFLVVWVSEEPGPIDPQGDNGFWLKSRYFDASGAPSGPERFVSQLDPTFPGGALAPDVAALTNGSFVVVWISATTNGTDGGRSVQARLVSAAGIPSGNQFQVNAEDSQNQLDPAVDARPGGGFVVAWRAPGIRMRRFTSAGVPVTSDIEIADSGQRPGLAVGELNGRVAVVWKDGSQLFTRLHTGTLAPITAIQQLSAPTDTDPNFPVVADWGFDGFLFAWETGTGVGDDDELSSIQARAQDVDGTFDGGQFQVNTWTAANQNMPALGSASGRTAIVWRSNGNTEAPLDDHIMGYLVDYCYLFCDDFETGETDRWDFTATP